MQKEQLLTSEYSWVRTAGKLLIEHYNEIVVLSLDNNIKNELLVNYLGISYRIFWNSEYYLLTFNRDNRMHYFIFNALTDLFDGILRGDLRMPIYSGEID